MATAVAPFDTRDEIIVGESDDKARELEQRVTALARASRDAIADTRTLKIIPSTAIDIELPVEDRITIEAPGGLYLGVSGTAHDQFAEKLGIPKPYYQRMLASEPQLLATNMNVWLNAQPEKRLLRMIEPVDSIDPREGFRLHEIGAKMRLRAFLGASYRPLDNAELIAAVLPTLREKGAYLKEFSLTDQRLHAKFLTTERDVKDIVREYAEKYGVTEEQARGHYKDPKTGKDISWVNEVVRMGVYLRNSETGFASLDVSGLVEVLKCLNAFVASAQTKVRHVGKKNQGAEDDLSFLSAQTQRLDNAAIFSRVRDTVIAMLDEQAQVNHAKSLASAKATLIETDIPMFEFVGRLGEQLQLTDAESEVLKEEVVRSNIVEGGFTQFSLAQGVTAMARETKDYDRRVELERAGWTIIESDATKLLAAGKAATRRRN